MCFLKSEIIIIINNLTIWKMALYGKFNLGRRENYILIN